MDTTTKTQFSQMMYGIMAVAAVVFLLYIGYNFGVWLKG